MKNKVLPSFEAAVADVPDGSTIMVPGFGTPGTPRNLMSALVDQGATNLATISNSVNRDIAVLVEARRVRKVYCAFTAPTHPSRETPFVRMYNNDEIDAELVPQGTLAERIRAAGAGIGAFYTPTSVGTELAEDKEHREINGRTHVLEYALPADYAFIRAWRADTFGNLQFRFAQRNFNPIMAMAADVTVVEVEHEIVDAGGIDPDCIHVPGVYVDRIVKIPPEGIFD
ncbi:MAG: 3-oxoacid CoA-transferase subunit A [Gammaproteobacteria bacterium]|nr:3-oxoacid CoA-transferase subunit A [Gammaproteobacteria bacterium]